MKSFKEVTQDWVESRKQHLAKREADLNAELDAAADYYERTGVSMHTLGSVEQKNIIEAWREDHEKI